jgi:glycosyltransferase involved in cell wall biosynthesis
MSYTGADLLITLVDPWVLDANVYGKLPWAAWAPIDSAPMLPANKDALAHASWILAMSRFGQDQIEAAGLGHKCFYVPHGVDTELFKPGNREEARQNIGKAAGRGPDREVPGGDEQREQGHSESQGVRPGN